MLKKNKVKVIVSSLIVLLPVLFGLILWKDLPNTMVIHFGADGRADGFGGKIFSVFGLPAVLLVLHLVCCLSTLLDRRQKDQNEKALNIVFWIVPVISLLVHSVIYLTALGVTLKLTLFVPVLLCILFVFIGNYMPKMKQNRTLGIKIPWTLANQENWNRTHRFGAKIWVICGFVLLICALLPVRVFVYVLLCVVAASALLPMAYSYHIYRRHLKQGIAYNFVPAGKAEWISAKASLVIAAVALIGVAVLLFTGDVVVTCGDTALGLHATYWTDIQVNYQQIDTAAYCENLDVGGRISGFGSPKLSLGTFQNDEFGLYTLYAYTDATQYIVLTDASETLVIGLRDAQKAQEIYYTVIDKLDKSF